MTNRDIAFLQRPDLVPAERARRRRLAPCRIDVLLAARRADLVARGRRRAASFGTGRTAEVALAAYRGPAP